MADKDPTQTITKKTETQTTSSASQQQGGSNGLALAALITGIFGLGLIPLFLGIFGLKKSKQLNGTGKGMAIAGIILGILGILGGIIIILIAFLATQAVLSPSAMLPERTTFQAPLPNIDNAVINSDGTVTIAFRNNKGSIISIPGTVQGDQDCAQASYKGGESNGQAITADTEIPNGDVFTLKFGCDSMKSGENFRAMISFAYKDVNTQLVRSQAGQIMGKVA